LHRLCCAAGHDVRLGKADGPGLIAASDVMARDHRSGLFYISQHFDQGVISVFDSLGAFVRAIGRAGRGPGEFLQIMDLAVADGGLFAFDSRNRRMTVLTQRDSVAATVPLMGSARPAGNVVFPGAGRVVMASHVQTPELSGHALHVFDWNGRRLASFDTTSGSSLLPQQLEVLSRRVTSDGANIWSAHVANYLVQKWSTDGRLLQNFQRPVRWFAPWKQRPAISPAGGRVTEIMDIRFDQERDLLWVLVQVPGDEPDWAEGLISERGEGGRMYYGPSVLDKVYDSVIEAVRVNAGEVVVSLRVEQALRRFLSGDRVASHVAADSDGIEYIDIWRIVGISLIGEDFHDTVQLHDPPRRRRVVSGRRLTATLSAHLAW
jgi:hypothetical protein